MFQRRRNGPGLRQENQRAPISYEAQPRGANGGNPRYIRVIFSRERRTCSVFARSRNVLFSFLSGLVCLLVCAAHTHTHTFSRCRRIQISRECSVQLTAQLVCLAVFSLRFILSPSTFCPHLPCAVFALIFFGIRVQLSTIPHRSLHNQSLGDHEIPFTPCSLSCYRQF